MILHLCHNRSKTGLAAAIALAGAFWTIPAARAADLIKLQIAADPGAAADAVAMLAQSALPQINSSLAAAGGKYTLEWTFAGAAKSQKPKSLSPKSLSPKSQPPLPQPDVPALNAVFAGEADIGLVDTRRMERQLPLMQITFQTPFSGLAPEQLVPVVAAIVDQAPEIRQTFLKRNQLLLAIAASSEFVLVSKFPLATLAALKGKKIGLTPTVEGWAPAAIATPVPATMDAFVDGLKSGAFDSVITDAANASRLKLTELAPHVTRAGMGAMVTTAITFNRDRWDSLPAPVRNALYTGLQRFQQQLARQARAANADAFKAIEAQGGKLASLSQDQRKLWAMQLADLPAAWPVVLKSTQQPVTQLISAYLGELASRNSDPLRKWALPAAAKPAGK